MRPLHRPEILVKTTAPSSVVKGGLGGVRHRQARGIREPLRLRAFALAFVALFALLACAPMCRAQKQPSLMTMIARWQYPDSKISVATLSDAATMNATGERTLPSVQYKAVLTTKDSFAKVVAYYKGRLTLAAGTQAAKVEGEAAADAGRSVTFHEDSEGRPLAIQVVLVNTDKTSTALVISRGATEPETHIAWTHYEKL
jgi:hypothetical protein